MSFRIRNEARDWFRKIRNPKALEIDFDSYYFCFIAGIAGHRKVEVDSKNTAELTRDFPELYSPQSKLLIGLLLTRELENLGVSMNSQNSVNAVISKLVKTETASSLSELGFSRFNQYANGGYEMLCEWFDECPQSLQTFLRIFNNKLNELQDKEQQNMT